MSKMRKTLLRLKLLDAKYDPFFAECMQSTALYMMKEFNAMYALTQSDEITMVLLAKPDTPEFQHIYGGKRDKLVSLAAADASVFFMRYFMDRERVLEKGELSEVPLFRFDCRMSVWDTERKAMGVLAWRAEDCARNGISDAALHYKKSLSSKNGREKLEALSDAGLLPLPEHQAYGSFYTMRHKTVNGRRRKTYARHPLGVMDFLQNEYQLEEVVEEVEEVEEVEVPQPSEENQELLPNNPDQTLQD